MREYGGASSWPTIRMSSAGAVLAQGFGGNDARGAVAENQVFHCSILWLKHRGGGRQAAAGDRR